MATSRSRLRLALSILTLGLAACGSATPTTSTPAPSTVAPSTSSVALASTVADAAFSAQAGPRPSGAGSTTTIAAGYARLPQSKTPEGYYQLGRPDAPLVMTYYSDFI